MNTTTKHEVIAEKAEQVRQSFWDITNIHEALESGDDFHIQMAIVDLENATRELYKAYHKLTTASLRLKDSEFTEPASGGQSTRAGGKHD